MDSLMVSGAGIFSVRDTKHASWPWSKQPLTAKGVRLGYLILCTVFGVAFAALGRLGEVGQRRPDPKND